jgi:hypothetical protein
MSVSVAKEVAFSEPAPVTRSEQSQLLRFHFNPPTFGVDGGGSDLSGYEPHAGNVPQVAERELHGSGAVSPCSQYPQDGIGIQHGHYIGMDSIHQNFFDLGR